MMYSPDAKRLVRCSGTAKNAFSIYRLLGRFLLCVVGSSVSLTLVSLTLAFAQDSPQTPAAPSAAQSESKPASEEIATHDEPTTFKVNSKLVVVRAVVRDSQGHAVGALHQEDFQVFDKGKPQVITQFDVERPGALTAKVRQESEKTPMLLRSTLLPILGMRLRCPSVLWRTCSTMCTSNSATLPECGKPRNDTSPP